MIQDALDRNQNPELGHASRRFAGPRVVLAGFLLVVLITAFVVVRILATSGPEPDEVPKRPVAPSGG